MDILKLELNKWKLKYRNISKKKLRTSEDEFRLEIMKKVITRLERVMTTGSPQEQKELSFTILTKYQMQKEFEANP